MSYLELSLSRLRTTDHQDKRGSGRGSGGGPVIAIRRKPLKEFGENPWEKISTLSSLLTCPSIYVPKMMGGVESIVFPIKSLTSHLSPDGADAGERKSPPCSGRHVVGSGRHVVGSRHPIPYTI